MLDLACLCTREAVDLLCVLICTGRVAQGVRLVVGHALGFSLGFAFLRGSTPVSSYFHVFSRIF